MLPLDIAVLALLIAALVSSIIELGLVAYLVSFLRQTFEVPSYDYADGDIEYTTYHGTVDGRISFLLFASLWSAVVSIALILRTVFNKQRRMSERTLGIWTFVLNALTMIFWLAGFAAYASIYDAALAEGVVAAIMAFAVIPWLIYLALLVLNFLTAFGTLRSDRPGYTPVFVNGRGAGAGPGPGPGATYTGAPAPGHQAPSYHSEGYQGAGYNPAQGVSATPNYQNQAYQPAQGYSATNNPPYGPAPGGNQVPMETRYVPESYEPAPGISESYEPKYMGGGHA